VALKIEHNGIEEPLRGVLVMLPLGVGPEGLCPSSEILKVSMIDGASCRVDCIPWFIKGVNRHDVIAVEERQGQLHFNGVISQSGHSTFHLQQNLGAIFPEGDAGAADPCYEAVLKSLLSHDCTLEAYSDTRTSLDVPPREDKDLRGFAIELLDVGKDVGLWTWSEGTSNTPTANESPGRDVDANSIEYLKLAAEARAKIALGPIPGWQAWWLSFINDEKPEGERSLGVCIVQIPDAEYTESGEGSAFSNALRMAHFMGCNPGGNVRGRRVFEDSPIFGKLLYNKLMDKAELDELGLL
jgi:hypothetical protein